MARVNNILSIAIALLIVFGAIVVFGIDVKSIPGNLAVSKHEVKCEMNVHNSIFGDLQLTAGSCKFGNACYLPFSLSSTIGLSNKGRIDLTSSIGTKSVNVDVTKTGDQTVLINQCTQDSKVTLQLIQNGVIKDAKIISIE